MKRLVPASIAAALFCGLAAPLAVGAFNPFNYEGQVKGQPDTFLGFQLAKSPSGVRKAKKFTVLQVPYTCTDAPSGTTGGWEFVPKMRIQRDRTFEGRGDWVDVGLDPVGKVSGKLRRSGVAVGEFRLRGELGGAGTHCATGLLEWRATKQQQPPPT